MSLRRNAISTAFLFLRFLTGMTATVSGNAELVAFSPVDVAHMRQFGSDILLTSPEWYQDGMQVFAWVDSGLYWKKRKVLTWIITKKSAHLKEDHVMSTLKAAFAKWAQVTPFTIEQASSSRKANIRIEFGRTKFPDADSVTLFNKHNFFGQIIDATMQFTDTDEWMDENKKGKANLNYVALYEMGHALGLADSDDPRAIMNRESSIRRAESPDDPQLADDDRNGIKAKYGAASAEASSSSQNDGKTQQTFLQGFKNLFKRK